MFSTLVVLTLAAAKPDVHVNPNSSPLDSLALVRGIGAVKAQRIIANRPYKDCAEIGEKVPGIGPKVLEKACPEFVF